MLQSIPAGLTRGHVLRTLPDLDAGLDHPCGRPTCYELIHDNKRYAPKAVDGLASRNSVGRILQPEEFSGGEAPGQPKFVFRKLGFTVIKKGDGQISIRSLVGPPPSGGSEPRQQFERQFFAGMEIGLIGWRRPHSQGARTGRESAVGRRKPSRHC